LIAEVDLATGSVVKVVEDIAQVVRLGEGVNVSRAFSPSARERTLGCLREYQRRVRDQGLHPESVLALATAQARDVEEASSFFREIAAETGFKFQILSGEEEAETAFYGALLPGMDASGWVVMDIGGGSTEWQASRAVSKQSWSLPFGAVKLSERFFPGNLSEMPVTDEEFWALREFLDQELSKLTAWRNSLTSELKLLGVAGTVTTLAAWHYGVVPFSGSRIDGLTLTRGDVHRMVEELKWRTLPERLELPGVQPGRADVLLAGAMILWRTMENLHFPEVTVSSRGLRFGAFRLTRSLVREPAE
jgi:exopolyphosphatase/guanosine-5'-triphosphate,3'-diphosphate pyrophosphatase